MDSKEVPVWLLCLCFSELLVNSLLLKEGMFSFLWIKISQACVHVHILAEGIYFNSPSPLAFLQSVGPFLPAVSVLNCKLCTAVNTVYFMLTVCKELMWVLNVMN